MVLRDADEPFRDSLDRLSGVRRLLTLNFRLPPKLFYCTTVTLLRMW